MICTFTPNQIDKIHTHMHTYIHTYIHTHIPHSCNYYRFYYDNIFDKINVYYLINYINYYDMHIYT
jgi:hypothetical protein